jgi:hypothetical protein
MKRYLLLTAILSALLSSAPAAGQMPGRLFFTPAERASIDQQAPAPPSTQIYRLDGALNPGNGRRTYWINGQAGDHPKPGLAVGDSSDAPLIPANSLRIHRDEANQDRQQ